MCCRGCVEIVVVAAVCVGCGRLRLVFSLLLLLLLVAMLSFRDDLWCLEIVVCFHTFGTV